MTVTATADMRGEGSRGWFRTRLAGPGSSLVEAIAKAEQGAGAVRALRHAGRDIFAARIQLDQQEGRGFQGLARIRNEMYITAGAYTYREARLERAGGDDLIQFCFNLAGDIQLEFPRQTVIRLHEPELLVYRHARNEDLPQRTPAGAPQRIVSLNLTARSLRRLFGRTLHGPACLEPVLSGPGAHSAPLTCMPLSAHMYRLTEALLAHELNDALDLLHWDAIATQLLCQAIKELNDTPAIAPVRGRHAVQAVRRILENELADPPSIDALARRVGMCATSLKRSFKAVHGETMGEFSVRLRMEHAMRLIGTGEARMAEISAAVGYRHQSTFAAAFGQFYGRAPRSFLKRPARRCCRG